MADLSIRAIKGWQWGKLTYTSQIHFDKLGGLLTVDEKRQRRLDPKKVESISKYVINGLSGQGRAGFSAIAVSLRNSGPLLYDDATGTLMIPHDEQGIRFFICDGQHRYYGINNALSKAANGRWEAEEEGERESWAGIFESFKSSMLPVVIFTSLTLDEEEQLFSDMNYLSTPVNHSKALLHDKRDPYNRMAKELANSIPAIAQYGIDEESKVLSEKRMEIATLATWNRCIRILINGIKESEVSASWNEQDYANEKVKLQDFWTALLSVMPTDFNDRGKWMITKSVFIQGLAAWGRRLFHMGFNAPERLALIEKLADFDWSYSNDAYSQYGGGSLNPEGRMQFVGTRAALKSIPMVLNDHVGISNVSQSEQSA